MSSTLSVPLKQCSRKEQCVHPDGSWLPATTVYFYTDNHLKSGLNSQCKACCKVRYDKWVAENREYYLEQKRIWKQANPEKVKAHKQHDREHNRASYNRRNKKHRDLHTTEYVAKRKHPERKAKKREYDLQYHRDHADEKRAISREWHSSNRERASARGRQWREANPDLAKAISRQGKIRRHAREFNAPGDYTLDDVRQIYERQQGLCCYCGIRLFDKWHEDHVHPISRGGSNYSENIALACKDCNLSKNNKTFEEWVLVRGW